MKHASGGRVAERALFQEKSALRVLQTAEGKKVERPVRKNQQPLAAVIPGKAQDGFDERCVQFPWTGGRKPPHPGL